MNNFEKFEEDLVNKFGDPPNKVKKEIDGSVGFFRIIGNIVELFIPKMMDLFINMSGGSREVQLEEEE